MTSTKPQHATTTLHELARRIGDLAEKLSPEEKKAAREMLMDWALLHAPVATEKLQ